MLLVGLLVRAVELQRLVVQAVVLLEALAHDGVVSRAVALAGELRRHGDEPRLRVDDQLGPVEVRGRAGQRPGLSSCSRLTPSPAARS